MVAWRLARPPHDTPTSAFSGEGARLFGGRWNSPAGAVVYASAALSLAALETLFHADRRSVEREYAAFRFEVADEDVRTVADSEVPIGWRERPVSLAARALGDDWLKSTASVALSVPSVVVPLERNLLVNPAHPCFASLSVSEPVMLRFDDRSVRS